MHFWIIIGLAALAVVAFTLVLAFLFKKDEPEPGSDHLTEPYSEQDPGPPMYFPLASAFNDVEYYDLFNYNLDRDTGVRVQGYHASHLLWMFENFMRIQLGAPSVQNTTPRFTTPAFPFWNLPKEISWQDVVRKDTVLEELKRGPIMLRRVDDYIHL